MKPHRLTLVALAILALSAVAGIAAYERGTVDQGLTYGLSRDDRGQQTLVVTDVRPGGLAWHDGVEPGFIVVSADITDGADNISEQAFTPPGAAELQRAALEGSSWLLVYMAKPGEVPSPVPEHYLGSQVFQPSWAVARLTWSGQALFAGGLISLVGLAWLAYRRFVRLTRLGWEVPLVGAAAAPLFLVPAYLTLAPGLVALTAVLVAASALVAALALAGHVGSPRARRWVLLGSTVLAGGAVIVGVLPAVLGTERGILSILRSGLVAAVLLLPAFVVAAQVRAEARRAVGPTRLATVLHAGDTAILATLPAVTLVPLAALTAFPLLQPLVVWVVVVLLTRGVAVLPVAREAAREARDRGLVVDEGESERARIAADIHDDVIQDLSMLVHRLDRAGEDEAAGTLRAAIDRLRAICADLRLPVIHDLGLAAALEALVGEVHAASGTEIELQCDIGGRLPYDVELGLYRIAQEAVANALKHGRPPIKVHLRAEPAAAWLEVEDRGAGVGPDALSRPASPGHLGFLTMAQRAEKLGAELVIADRPEGGTRVGVVWTGLPRSAATQDLEVNAT